MKMLMFDFRESERDFFLKNKLSDLEITFFQEPLNEKTQLSEEQLNETDVISVFISSSLTENVLKKFKNLRIIATRSTGYNHIDMKYCIANNIAVYNVANYGQNSVAQFSIGMIMILVRNVFSAYTDMKKNMINHKNYEGRNLNNLTLGVIGCGAIGSVVAKTMNFLGMKVLVSSNIKREDVAEFAQYVTLDELLEKSDVITLHLSYSPDTYHLIGEKEFKKMKNGVYIVNTARGEFINIAFLYENIVSGKVKGAALDVLECEYLTGSNINLINDINCSDDTCIKNALITQKLLDLDNVIITPHIAYNTVEAIETLLKETFYNISNYSKGDRRNRIV